MTAFQTTVLPPAFLGLPYEASFALVGGAAIAGLAVSLSAGDNGLPPGLTVNAGSGTITGTPTGAASTGFSAGLNQSGEGNYLVTLTTTSGTPKQYTINLYSSPSDPKEDSDESVAAQAAERAGTDQ